MWGSAGINESRQGNGAVSTLDPDRLGDEEAIDRSLKAVRQPFDMNIDFVGNRKPCLRIFEQNRETVT